MNIINSIQSGLNTVQLYSTTGFSTTHYTVRYLVGSESIFTGKYATYEEAERVFDSVNQNRGVLYV